MSMTAGFDRLRIDRSGPVPTSDARRVSGGTRSNAPPARVRRRPERRGPRTSRLPRRYAGWTWRVIALLTDGVEEQARQPEVGRHAYPRGSRERRRSHWQPRLGRSSTSAPARPRDGSRASRPLQVSRAQPAAGTSHRVPPPACRRNRAGSGVHSMALRSRPPQNRSPAPVTRIAPTPGSSAMLRTTSSGPPAPMRSSALAGDGLFRWAWRPMLDGHGDGTRHAHTRRISAASA